MIACLVAAVAGMVAATAHYLPYCGCASEGELRAHPQLAVISLKRTRAPKIARKLKALMGGDRDIVIVTDEETETIFIRGNAEKIREARRIVDRLDVPSYLTLVTLNYADPIKAANKLKAILGDESETKVVAIPNNVLLLATWEKAQQARNILHRLDVNEQVDQIIRVLLSRLP